MKLVLTAYCQDPQITLEDSSRVVEAGGLRIGRGKDNDWVLPDPQRHLSKNHCMIECVDGQFSVIDTSSNGVFLNNDGDALGRDNAAILQDGDFLRFGPYEIDVRVEDAGSAFSEPYGPEPTVDMGTALGPPEPYDAPGEWSDDWDKPGPGDPDDEFRRRPTVGPGSRQGGFDAFATDFDGVEKGRDEQFDRFGIGADADRDDGLGFGQDRPLSGAGSHPDDPFADPGRRTPRNLIPDDADLFGPEEEGAGWGGHSAADHVPEERQAFAIPRPQRDQPPKPAPRPPADQRAALPPDDPFAIDEDGPPPFGGPDLAGPPEPPRVRARPPEPMPERSPFETSPGEELPGRRDVIPADFDDFGELDDSPFDEGASPGPDFAPPSLESPPPPPPQGPSREPPRIGSRPVRGAPGMASAGAPPPPPPAAAGLGGGEEEPASGPMRPHGAAARRRGIVEQPEPQRPGSADEPFHPSTTPPSRGRAGGQPRPRPRAATGGRQEPQDAGTPLTGDPVAAFLAACGLENSGLSDEAAERLLHTVGIMMREMVHGVIEVLKVRASIRDEFRVSERTMIRPTENNPLKFSIDVDDALHALLVQPRPGYLPPEKATQEAFRDLRAHQLAVMTGMQVALTALLNRFNPDALARRLEQQSVWDSILPSARKAKYWELFRELYSEIAREAEDDFHGLFGKEFTKAYEDQLRKL